MTAPVRILQIDDLDAWQPRQWTAQWALRLLQKGLAIGVRRATRDTRPESWVILGPESMKSHLKDRCMDYATYRDEHAGNAWGNLRIQATRIVEGWDPIVAPLWTSEAEARAWRAVRPWIVQKWTYQKLGIESMLARLAERYGFSEDVIEPLRPAQKWLAALHRYFERRERTNQWNHLRHRHAPKPFPAHRVQALLLSTGLYSPRIMIPLARELTRRGIDHHLLANASRAAWPYNPALSPDDVSWNYFLDGSSPAELDATRHRFQTRAEVVLNALPSELRKTLNTFLREDWVLAGGLDAAIGSAYDRLKPGVIVGTKNVRVLEGVCVENAKARGIPVVFIDQGIRPNDVDHAWIDANHHVVAAGPQTISAFERLNVSSERLHRFGDMRFDEILGSKLTSNGVALLKKDRIPVLAVGETIGEYTTESELKSFYQALQQLTTRLPQLDLTLKLHPKQSVRQFKHQRTRWGLEGLRWTKDGDMFHSIAQSAFVITHVSLVAIETLYLGWPLVCYLEGMSTEKRTALAVDNPALEPGYAAAAFSPEELIATVERLLTVPEAANDLRSHAAVFKSSFLFNDNIPALTKIGEQITRMSRTTAAVS